MCYEKYMVVVTKKYMAVVRNNMVVVTKKYMVVVTQMERIVLQLSRVLLSQVTSRTLKTPLSKWLAFQYTNTIIMMTVFIGYTWGPVFGSGCPYII